MAEPCRVFGSREPTLDDSTDLVKRAFAFCPHFSTREAEKTRGLSEVTAKTGGRGGSDQAGGEVHMFCSVFLHPSKLHAASVKPQPSERVRDEQNGDGDWGGREGSLVGVVSVCHVCRLLLANDLVRPPSSCAARALRDSPLLPSHSLLTHTPLLPPCASPAVLSSSVSPFRR